MIEELLNLDFTRREAEAYLALNKLEKATASELAKKTQEHRTNIYDSMNSLIKKGLVTYFIKNNVKYFTITSPDKIFDMLQEKEKIAHSLIEKLKLEKKDKNERHIVEIYEGKEGFKTILLKMLMEEKTIYGIGASEEWEKRFPIKISQYMHKRQKKNIKAKLLYVKGSTPIKHTLNEIKFLPTSFKQPSTIAIFGDYVVNLMWVDPLVATLTESKQLSKSYKKYFQLLWKTAK